MASIAIIGSGIAGLGCAWFLRHDYDVSVFEADERLGGHAHTVWVDESGRRLPIDTGFMVFNHVTYPNLLRLFGALGVPMKPTDMSFSVRHGPRALEYRGTSLNTLFAQRSNLLRPSFYRLLRQIDRFNREAVTALEDPAVADLTLADYVGRRGYGADFLELYLAPMSSAVWSTPPEKMMRFPATTLLRFFHNHGFLGLHTQHPWWTIDGGSRLYVERLAADCRPRIHLGCPVRQVRRTPMGAVLDTDDGPRTFDYVILACHPPESLRLLGAGASPLERRLLSAFRYQPNTATLHTDESVMPERRLAWSAWNYRLEQSEGAALHPSTHYWMNRLQGVSNRRNYFVSLNAEGLVDPARVLRTLAYEHPLFDLAARRAQPELLALNEQALSGTWTLFAGAWQGYGFHEDGLVSALSVCRLLLQSDPWLRRRALEVT
ncbi:MAG TPA: FAD-dependent oxidoreductase [Opitutaceae bacterium]|nr:FAD-dependent oxidoreductase [Opitutaceae bacterium]